MTSNEMQEMPFGIGKFTSRWVMFTGAAVVLLLVGLIAYAYQLSEGEIVTGMRNIGTMGGATWGIYIAMGVYFIGVSFAGITIAALIRLFRLDHLKPISRMAEWLTVIALLLGALSIMADLGRPLQALYLLPKFVRPQSPFFGTFTLVISGYLFASLVFLYLDGRRDAAVLAKFDGPFQRMYRLIAAGYHDTKAERARHDQVTLVLSVAIIVLLVIAHTTLGFIFGLQSGRPGWFGALQGPSFVILAGVSGVGAIIVLAWVMQYVLEVQERINMRIFAWLGKSLLVLTLVYLYLWLAELLTTTYAGAHKEQEVLDAIIWGDYAWIFWLTLACLVLPVVMLMAQAMRKRWSVPALVVCGLLVNVAAIGKRYLIVVPSQTHGTLLPYVAGSYSPTWVEYSVIIGFFGLGALLFAVLMKMFPFVPIVDGEPAETAPEPETAPVPAGGEA